MFRTRSRNHGTVKKERVKEVRYRSARNGTTDRSERSQTKGGHIAWAKLYNTQAIQGTLKVCLRKLFFMFLDVFGNVLASCLGCFGDVFGIFGDDI